MLSGDGLVPLSQGRPEPAMPFAAAAALGERAAWAAAAWAAAAWAAAAAGSAKAGRIGWEVAGRIGWEVAARVGAAFGEVTMGEAAMSCFFTQVCSNFFLTVSRSTLT